ncbi:T1SS secreted agglutinin RTX [Pseudomonas synxantha]|uniref:T1SS secreted agglutinin RTX n=1 Tax=Pseudomonas synxantha TaxID=47883 RepID=A0A3G7UC94_9PSED|nr:Ig-like domain-containing protein [Pseudomonas synxantha]AZE56831.1 T1SS secreted agglutinin RTX [Pseudomonas synxantha]
MNANVVNVAVVDGKTITQTVELSSANNGQPVRIKAVQGGKYILAEGANGAAPENITIKRVGKDLHIALEGSDPDQPQLIIEDFEGSGGQLVGVAEDGSYHEYISSDAEQDRSAAFLIEGVEAPQVLGAQPLVGFGDGLAAAAGIGWFWPALLGLAALGVLGGVYAATRDDGNGNDDGAAPGTGNPDKGAVGGVDDNVGNNQGLIENGGSTDDRTPTFTGDGRPGTSVEIIDNGKTIGTAIVGEDGKWEYTPPVPGLDDGKHEIVIVPVDKDGNKGEPSPGYEIIVDTVAPSQPLIDGLFDDVAPQEGQIGIGGHTNDTTPTLSGTGEAGSIIHIYDNGVEIGTALADAGGKWSFTPDPALTEGPHEFTVTAEDAAGNISTPSLPFPIIVDITLPGKPGVGTGGIEDVRDNVGLEQGSIGDGDSTDDTTPTLIGGGAEPGDTIIIIDNGVEIGTAIVGEDGKWEFTPDPELTEGSHEIVVVIKDPAGNESEPSDPHTIIVDTTAPGKPGVGTGGIEDVRDNVGLEQGSIVDGGLTDDNTPTLIGSGGEPGDTVIVIVDGNEIGTAMVDENGRWELTPDPALNDGSHEIVVVIKDPAGNESEPSDPHTIIVDTAAPAAPTLDSVHDDQGNSTGDLVSGQITDDARPDLSGTAEPGSLVTIYDNGVAIGSVVATGGTWTFTPALPLTNGSHSLAVTATDPAGNESAPTADFDLNVLAGGVPTAPAIITVEDDQGTSRGPIAPNQSTDDARPTINGTGASGDTITVYANGQALGTTFVDGNGQWTFTPPTALADGLHNLSAQATDAAGNLSPVTGDYPINVDTVAPGAPVSQVLTDDVGTVVTINPNDVTDDANPTFSGTAEAGSIVKIYDNGTLIGSAAADATTGAWSFTPATALIDGAHSFSAEAVDGAGNVGPMGPAIPFTVDTSAVVISITSVEDNAGTNMGPLTSGQATDDTTPTLSGSATPGGTVSIYDGTTLLGTVMADATTGQWTFTTPVLSTGSHDLTATVTTAAGGESAPTAVFETIIDTTAPGVPVIDDVDDNVGVTQGTITDGGSTDDSTPTLSGDGLRAGDTVKIYDGSVLLGTTTVGTDGSWLYVPTTPLNDGRHEFTVVAVDPAGNASAPSDSYTVIIDTSAPGAPVSQVLTDDVGTVVTINPNDVTDDANPTFSGTAEAGSIVKIYDNGNLIGSAAADATTGAWSFTPTAALIDGGHSFSAQAVDGAGNVGPMGPSIPFTVFTLAAVISITSVEDNAGTNMGLLTSGQTTDDTTPTLSGSATPGGTVRIYDGTTLLGTVMADATTGQWTFTTPVLSTGNHDLTATVTTAAGGESAPTAVFETIIDTTAPGVPVIGKVDDNVGVNQGPIADGGSTDDATPTLSGDGLQPDDTVEIYNGSVLLGTTTVGTDGSWVYVPTTPLNDGRHAFTIVAVDPVGNISAPSASHTITVDTSVPAASVIVSLTDDLGAIIGQGGATTDRQPTVNGTAEPGTLVTVFVDNVAVGSVMSDQATGGWTYEVPSSLALGFHNVTASARDAAGNSGPVSTPYQVGVGSATSGGEDFTGIASQVIQVGSPLTTSSGLSVAVETQTTGVPVQVEPTTNLGQALRFGLGGDVRIDFPEDATEIGFVAIGTPQAGTLISFYTEKGGFIDSINLFGGAGSNESFKAPSGLKIAYMVVESSSTDDALGWHMDRITWKDIDVPTVKIGGGMKIQGLKTAFPNHHLWFKTLCQAI